VEPYRESALAHRVHRAARSLRDTGRWYDAAATGQRPMKIRQPAALIEQSRIIVCVGTGGVGKTTVAAAVAAEAAARGRRALVLTIDPARRLADALGAGELDGEPQELSNTTCDALGIGSQGQLFAMMLDMKSTFDGLVERFADGPETMERILGNRIYQHVSDALAGSSEYAAMERVYEVSERSDFDLIVVDTPPSQHALDFLDAPRRLIEFLDNRIVQLLVHPAFVAGRLGFKLFHRASHTALKLIERASGVSFIEDLSEFLMAFEVMSEGFRERARRVRSLLLGPDSGFILVAGPSRETVRSADDFLEQLKGSGVPMAGVVLNRVRLWPDAETDEAAPVALLDGRNLEREQSLLAKALENQLADATEAETASRAAVSVAGGYAALVQLDERSSAPLRERARREGLFVRQIPELPRDIHDLAGLREIAQHLFREPSEGDG
jgi:anion-transporting  ArsA/GET3 family ATPase